MPELSWYYGYPFALGVMLILFLMTLWLMWSKGWLSAFSQSPTSKTNYEREDKR
jgi:hypothetical protein